MARTKPPAADPDESNAAGDKSKRVLTSREPPLAKANADEVRTHLRGALDAMLVGPFVAEGEERAGEEILHIPPSRWYLTGFLVPEADERSDDDGEGLDDELERPDERSNGDEPAEGTTKHQRLLPASMGMTVLLPPAGAGSAPEVELVLCYADYQGLGHDDLAALGLSLPRRPGKREPARDPVRPSRKLWFKRDPQVRDDLRIRVEAPTERPLAQVVKGTRGLELVHQLREVRGVPGIVDGTRALSVFVVNRRDAPGPAPEQLSRADEHKVFQVGLELRYAEGLVARVDQRFSDNDDADDDDKIADLQYRDVFEWAVGHSVAAEPIAFEGKVIGAKTCWLPRRRVAKVEPTRVDDVVVEMEQLANLEDGPALRAALRRLPDAYGDWIDRQAAVSLDGDGLRVTRDALVAEAKLARRRLEAGIELLARDAQVRHAFCMANRAMHEQAIAGDRQQAEPRYSAVERPKWRLFQLAFVLLNLNGIAGLDPERPHDDRELVELLYFPTGGGKTEAYLGLIAFTLLLRRLRGRTRADRGYGVAIILRYTLRLLTLDQFERAARLMCALELIRRKRADEFGELRFSVGLWVGSTATANTLRDADRRLREWLDDGQDSSEPPAPLGSCPWCGTSIGYKKKGVERIGSARNPTGIRLECGNRSCDFDRRKPDNVDPGLPVVYVDEQIYRELPCFLLATVDKFAMMPFRGETAMLFGRVHSRQGSDFFGPLDGDGPSPGSQRLPEGLRPPELIVQDELHLISGPLGTMFGLYESVVERLSQQAGKGPKIIASTATVRRAEHQVRALFGGREVKVFPPRGTGVWDSFFAAENPKANRREYLGVAAPGRSLKRVLLNVYTTLLGAAARCWDPTQPASQLQAADPYMTLVGYFNGLRELAGTTRLVEDQVLAAMQNLHERKPVDFEGPHPWLAGRTIARTSVELTSREDNDEIKRSKARLAWLAGRGGSVDVALASNMIGTGIDIERLGLMVIAGQPKSTSDYIQGSSRVGRDDRRPGLVVTVYNLHKPRDRSHYEHFGLYHETFYRAVETKSVTPFSLPALERGLTGVLMAMVRLENQAMTPKDAVLAITEHPRAAKQAIEFLVARALGHRLGGSHALVEELAGVVRDRSKRTIDDWDRIARAATSTRVYSGFDVRDRRGTGHEGKELLRTLEQDLRDPAARNRTDDEARFAAPTSLRDVEPVVQLWVRGRH